MTTTEFERSTADQNRAASKKFFEQWMKPRRVAAPFGTDEPPTMLRRCPSGARKKIQQRREEKQSQSSVFASTTNLSSYSSSSSASTTESPELPKFDYRSLLNSGGYRSILPDDNFEKPKPRFTSSMTSLYNPSMVDITVPDQEIKEPKASPPLPLPRSRPSSFDESFESSSESSASIAPPTPTGKPTVQVMPMPAQRHFPVIEAPEAIKMPPPLPAKRERPKPPPVPKKPLGLTNKLAFQRAQMSKSCANSMDTLSSSSPPPLTKLAPSPLSSSGFFSSVQSQECLNRLCASPSLLSLQTALQNLQGLTADEVDNLEDRRHQLIASMSKKVAILDEERTNIDEELDANEEFKKSTFGLVLEHNPTLLKRTQTHLTQRIQIAGLEARLRDDLEKIDQALAGNTDEPEFLSLRRQRLQDQFNDIAFLRGANSKRDEEISTEVENALERDITLLEQWRYYKETLIKLNVEKRQIADRLNVAKSQLKSLHTLSL